jgi:hypothetical protein
MTESLPGNKKVPVYVCAVGDPVASVAEWVVGKWLATYNNQPVALVLVQQENHSALLTALRARFQHLEHDSCWNENKDRLYPAVQAATDSGACLIAGGSAGHPSLVANVVLSGRLLDTLQAPAPALLVVCQEENFSAVEDLAERLLLHPFSQQADSNH